MPESEYPREQNVPDNSHVEPVEIEIGGKLTGNVLAGHNNNVLKNVPAGEHVTINNDSSDDSPVPDLNLRAEAAHGAVIIHGTNNTHIENSEGATFDIKNSRTTDSSIKRAAARLDLSINDMQNSTVISGDDNLSIKSNGVTVNATTTTRTSAQSAVQGDISVTGGDYVKGDKHVGSAPQLGVNPRFEEDLDDLVRRTNKGTQSDRMLKFFADDYFGGDTERAQNHINMVQEARKEASITKILERAQSNPKISELLLEELAETYFGNNTKAAREAVEVAKEEREVKAEQQKSALMPEHELKLAAINIHYEAPGALTIQEFADKYFHGNLNIANIYILGVMQGLG